MTILHHGHTLYLQPDMRDVIRVRTADVKVPDVCAVVVSRPPLTSEPAVSVIVPVTGSEYVSRLRHCLDSVRRQLDYPPEQIEIIVSNLVYETDEDAASMQSLCLDYGAVLVTTGLHKRPFNLSLARNIGARHASGEVLCFVDADVVLDPETVVRAVPALTSPPARDNLVVVTTAYMGPNFRGATSEQAYSTRDPRAFRSFVTQGSIVLGGFGGCAFVGREMFHRLRGYDEGYEGWGGEDNDFADRCLNAGGGVHFLSAAQGIVVMHQYHDRMKRQRSQVVTRNRERYRKTCTQPVNEGGWGRPPLERKGLETTEEL